MICPPMDYFLAKLLKVTKGVLLVAQTHVVVIHTTRENVVYVGHHKVLQLNHLDRSNRNDFNRKSERRTPNALLSSLIDSNVSLK
jgi:hypothetical protein